MPFARLPAALLACLFLALQPAASATRAARFEDGLKAYGDADFEQAFAIWWTLSGAGDAKAQASLGYLFFKGLGIRQDDAQARVWFQRAAERGQASAQYFLGVIYMEGRGVERDYPLAYMWCDAAITDGLPEGLSCRDAAGLHMNDADYERSNRLLADWYGRRNTHP